MVQIDWKKIMAITPESMTEQDKDDFYEIAASYLPDQNTNRKYLLHFIKMVQEILKFKSIQVESLMNELDDIAAKQGEQEVSDRQLFLNEIDKLKEQLDYYKRLTSDTGKSAYSSSEELRNEIMKLELQNEELVLVVQERDKELLKEKMETENFASQIAALERENQELKREVAVLQEDTKEKLNGRSLQESPEFGPEKQEEMTELIRQKNKHITQLLDDLDDLEKQNVTLKSKLTNVCDELSEATNHINEMTMHLSQMKYVNEELNRKIEDTEEKNNSLIKQIEELVEEKAKHDKQLDEFGEVLNSKTQEWSKTLEEKDNEILRAEEEIKKLLFSSSSKFLNTEFADSEMKKKVAEQEEQILNMKNELIRATHEINNCTELIENFKEKQMHIQYTGSDQLQSQFAIYQEKIQHLEEKLKHAEEDAQAKAEEISEIVIQLREYEMGEFGLADAVCKIKNLEKSLKKRDLQIEKLVESCNNLELEFENLEEQNVALRERLGLSASEKIDTTDVKLKFRRNSEIVENLKFNLDKKEEELIKAKLKCRKLIKFIKLRPRTASSNSTSDDLKEQHKLKTSEKYREEKASLEKKLMSIIKENDALRKGMHEILESIQSQDGAGTVEIQSICLERLLEALDSRHVSGWYHPAMRLQAQLNNAEGKNEELRNQIRSFREEEKNKNNELRDAHIKIQNLETQLFTLRSPREEVSPKSKSPEFEVEDAVLSSQDKRSITNLEQEQKIMDLEAALRELNFSYSKLNTEFVNMESGALNEKEKLLSQIAGMEKQIASLEGNAEPGLVDLSLLQSQIVVLDRRVQFLLQKESTARTNDEILRRKMLDQEERFLQETLRLKTERFECLLKIESLEKDLLQTVPKSKLNCLHKKLVEMTSKYQDAVASNILKNEDATVDRLEEEIRLLYREKNEVLDELRIAKEKFFKRKSLIKKDLADDAEEWTILAEKLAASEVRELNEKQKSAHLEKINLILKSELQDLEAYNKEIRSSVEELKQMLRAKQNEESSVHDIETHETELYNLREKIEDQEKKLRILENEKSNFRELFEMSQKQCRSLEGFREYEKLRISSLNEQVLLLQSAADEKAIVARLSHELLTCQLSLSQSEKDNCELQDQVTKLLAKNLILETKVDEGKRENFDIKRTHFTELDNLHKVMSFRRTDSTVFPNAEMVHRMRKRLKESQNEERQRLKELRDKIMEYSVKKEELEMKVEGLEALAVAFKGDNNQLMAWYNKGTGLRIEVARSRRQNQFLSDELSQMEGYVKKMDEELIALEELALTREKEWDRKQIEWEQSRFQYLQVEVSDKAKVSYRDESTETADVFSDGTKIVAENQANIIKKYEAEIKELKIALNRQKKPASIESDEKLLAHEVLSEKEEGDETEKAALKITVQSLQSIIRRKEETIYKYQELLKEGRDEYSKSSGRFQEELRTLHDALTKQSKAYSKLKNSLEKSHQVKDILPKAFERYLNKIHELEDDLADCQMTLTSVNRQLSTCEHEKEKWRNLAEERITLMDDMRHSLELEYKKELDNYRSEIENYQAEIERLKRFAETIHQDGSGDHNMPCQSVIDIQEKQPQYESDSPKDKEIGRSLGESSTDRDQAKEIRSLERQLKFAKEESTRLREQLRLAQLQKNKRPKTGSSITSRSGSDSKSSLKEESLQSKVKTLEELLKIAKERELDMVEGNEHKIKSAEEVARWGERKKSQHTIQNLNSKLKERDAEIEMLKSKNESFRNMIHKCEREKNTLELQLKGKDGPNSLNCRIDQLTEDKFRLEKEVAELKNQLEIQIRHEGGIGAALLHEKLESQERKIAVLELASQGRSSIVEELGKLQSAYSNLEKCNLKLESENLALLLQLEKEKAELNRAIDRNVELKRKLSIPLDASREETQESDRKMPNVTGGSDKVTDCRRSFRSTVSSRLTVCSEKLKKDYAKLKEDHKTLRKKYLEMIDNNNQLEEELKKCRYQIHLLQEKDLSESISRTNNMQLASELSQELLQVKAQLNHKTHLLSRVKVLLTKAAAKERALNEKVNDLQNMVGSKT